MTAALQATALGKRYGHTWALRDCTLTLPDGRVAALVGPNGAGKTTLLQLAVGLTAPTCGHITIFGLAPHAHPKEVLPRIGFVAQEQPLYRGFTVAEMLTVGRKLNHPWDNAVAEERLARLGIPLGRRIGQLSARQATAAARAGRARRRARSLGPARLPPDPHGSRRRERSDRLVLLPRHRRPGARLRLPHHPVGVPGAARRRHRHDCPGPQAPGRPPPRSRRARPPAPGDPRAPQRAANASPGAHHRPIYDPSWDVRDVAFEDIVLGYLDHHAQETAVRPDRLMEVSA